MCSLSGAVRCALVGALFALFSSQMADACSCMPSHPQENACKSDFVIVARVKKHIPKEGFYDVYKVNIKKDFKMSDKARIAMKSGRLVTADQSSMCGVHLNVDETYLIVGNVVSGKAWMSLCSFIKPWKDVTLKQRKGFRLLYTVGCSHCQVMNCPWYRHCPPTESDTCAWTTQSDSALEDCQATSSVCTRHPGGRCGWIQDRGFKECMKGRRRVREEEMARKQDTATMYNHRRGLPHK